MAKSILELYAVRNKDGQWFKNKGYGGYGKSWVDKLSSARIYASPGPARGQITFWGTHYPEYGVPDLIRLKVTEIEVCDEAERVKKVQREKGVAIQEAKIRDNRRRVREAKKQLEEAQKKLVELGEDG